MDQLIKLLESGDCESLQCQNQDDFFNQIYEEYLQKGYVKDTFLNAIKKREAEFPTGLVAGNHNIAINHVDSEHVNTNALFIYHMTTPVQYRRMDKPEELLDVQIIFVLLIKEPSLQVKAISEACQMWQNAELMNAINEGATKDQIIQDLKNLK